MPKLTASQLERLRWSCQGWVEVMNDFVRALEARLLRLGGLLDCQIVNPQDGDVLVFDAGVGKFRNLPRTDVWTTTTTTV